MQGRRVYPDEKGHLWLKEGDYGKDKDGIWLIRPPGCHAGSIRNHKVIEHENGTITVSPSVVLYDSDEKGNLKEAWHGFLQKGVWRTA